MSNVLNPVVDGCCGCGACVNVCPKDALSMAEDREGFLYPSLDASRCVDCSLCTSVCPVLKPGKASRPLAVFAAKNRDEAERRSSSSGGIFLPLARQVTEASGTVFGVAFGEGFRSAEHQAAQNSKDLARFSGSKYIQSNTGLTFRQVRKLLEEGRQVMYTGTPCQIAGLRSYLRKDYEGLFCVDLVCHSVPSPMVWRRYLDELRPGELGEVSFRDKVTGWKLFSLTLRDTHGKVVFSQREDENVFMKGFLKDLYCRPSCHRCPARGGRSGSDITIADFWKLKKFRADFDDNVGVGLVLVRTEKGRLLYDRAGFESIECTYEQALYGNAAMEKDAPAHPRREEFFRKAASGRGRLVPFIRRATADPLSLRIKKMWKKFTRKRRK